MFTNLISFKDIQGRDGRMTCELGLITTFFPFRREMQAVFCKERNWDQFHSPRNVLLALVGEVGELAEIL